MNRHKSADWSEYFLIFLGIVFLIAFFSPYRVNETEEYSTSLYTRLDTVLKDKPGVFLHGEKSDYFVLRSLVFARIEVYPADKKLRLLSGEGETWKFLISPKSVEISRARCVATKYYSVACESDGELQKANARDISKILELIDSAELVDVVISQGGDEA